MYHQITILGNVNKKPTLCVTPNGQEVTNFGVAANQQYTDSSGNLIKTRILFRVSVWGKQAQTCCTHLNKGSKVLVTGHLLSDKDTGGPRIRSTAIGQSAQFEVSAETVRFVSLSSAIEDEYEQLAE